VLHPDDAAARGLKDGVAVELFSRHGAVRLQLRVSDETGPWVAFVPGQRRPPRWRRHREHAVLGSLQRHGRGSDLPEHAARRTRCAPRGDNERDRHRRHHKVKPGMEKEFEAVAKELVAKVNAK